MFSKIFQVGQTHFESIGKLDSLVESGTDKYTNIIIDEAHRFRTENNTTYESWQKFVAASV